MTIPLRFREPVKVHCARIAAVADPAKVIFRCRLTALRQFI
ncbi:hypothetical protein [Leisingera sp. ANG59]|nr:hypothetical protein [Leisingera sp. ANG59]